MATFTQEEKRYISLGIEEEKKGARIHLYPKNETMETLQRYIRAQEEQSIDNEICVAALHDIADYWKIYFEEGEKKAKQIQKKKREQTQKEINEELEIIKRREEERALAALELL